jgi:hypothetical protein
MVVTKKKHVKPLWQLYYLLSFLHVALRLSQWSSSFCYYMFAASGLDTLQWAHNNQTGGGSGNVAVETLSYKPEGSGFETRWDEWIFFNLPNPSNCTRPWDLLSP